MKYLRLFEDLINKDIIMNNIDWDMIQDIKDISLEYLDNGMQLLIYVEYYLMSKYGEYSTETMYVISFSHDKNLTDEEYRGDDCGIEIKDFNLQKIKYNVNLHKESGILDVKATNELRNRIRLAYPNILYGVFN